MAMADAVLKTVQQQMRESQKIAAEFSAVLNKVRLDERNVAQTVTGAQQIKKSLKEDEDQAIKTKAAMSDMNLGGTAGVVANAAIQERALNRVRDAAIEARIAESLVGNQGTGVLRPFTAPGGAGQFIPGAAQAEANVPPRRGFYQPPPRGFIGGAVPSTVGPSGGIQYTEPIGPLVAEDSAMMKQAAADREALKKYQEFRKSILDNERVRAVGPLPDYVRLYRGESAGAVTNVPDWMASNQGRWFTDSLAEAERYAKTRGGEVQAVDVLRTVAQAAQTTRPLGGAGGQEFLLPAEVAALKRPLSEIRQQEARGAIPMPAAPGLVGGEQEFRQLRERLLESQRAASGALMMGPAAGRGPTASEAWFRQFETRVRGSVNAEARAREMAARSFLSSRGIQDIGRGFESLGGGLMGRPDPAGGGGDGDSRRGFLGFGDGRPGGIARAIASSLPGGRRPSTLALTTLAGLGVAALPAAGPAAVGGAFGAATAGLGALAGTIGTLQLAFADLSKQAFTNRQEFDKLTPIQQQLVQTIRSLDAGLVKNLEGIAQAQLLPRLTSAMHSFFSPGMAGALQSGVGAFGQGIGSGVQQVATQLGGQGFTSALGPVLQADARYTQNFIVELGKLADAWVHVSQAAIPFTDWLDKLAMHLATWTDNVIKAQQASGGLAHFFDEAKLGLQVFGDLVVSVGHLLGSFVGLVGFQNSLATIALLTTALTGIANLLDANRDVFQHFFAGGLQAANDVFMVIGQITRAITPLLHALQSVTDAIGGWRVAFDAFFVFFAARVGQAMIASLAMVIAKMAALGVAATVATAGISTIPVAITGVGAAAVAAEAGPIGLRAALMSLSGAPVMAGLIAVAALLAEINGLSGTASKVAANTQAAGLPANVGSFQGQPSVTLGKGDYSITFDASTGKYTENFARGPFMKPPKVVSTEDAAKRLGITVEALQMAVAANTSTGVSGVGFPGDVDLFGNRTARDTGSSFSTPAQFSGAKGNILPQQLLTAIAAADYTQNVAQAVSSRQTAIAWIDAHRGQYKGVDLQNLLGEGASLKQQITTLTGAGALRSGIGFLSQGLQERLAGAQQATAGVGITGTSVSAVRAAGPQAVQAQIASLRDLVKVEAESYNYLLKQTASGKEMKALTAARVAMSKELASSLKELAAISAAEVKAVAQDKFDTHISKILGIGGGVAGTQSLRTRERSILMSEARRAGIVAPGGLSLPDLVKNLQAQGADIPKATLSSLHKINMVLEAAKQQHMKLSVEARQNISARLTQINETLKAIISPSNYVAPSETKLTAGLGLTHENRLIAEARIAGALAHRRGVPSGIAVGGVPLSPTGQPLTASHVTQHVTIHIKAISPAETARSVREELLKTARRNPTQTRGPNAGRKMGLT